MKKIIITLLVCLLALSLCACAEAPEDASADQPAIGAQTVNPVSEATLESLLEDTGLDIGAAGRFGDVSYYRIDAGDLTIADARFAYDGAEYDFRAAASGTAQDISGMNYNWSEESTAPIGESSLQGDIKLSEDGAGVISWFDAVPGVMYSLSTDKDASAQKLAELAGELYVPVQGDADGDLKIDAEFADKIYDLLIEIRDNYHPGTAGSSLTGARYAAEMADLFAQYKPDPRQVTQAVEAFKEQKVSTEDEALFDEQIESIAGSFTYISSEEGKGILEDAGYESAGLEWDDAVKELFDALIG